MKTWPLLLAALSCPLLFGCVPDRANDAPLASAPSNRPPRHDTAPDASPPAPTPSPSTTSDAPERKPTSPERASNHGSPDGVEPPGDIPATEAPAEPEPMTEPMESFLVTWTAAGELALVDAGSGKIVATSDGAGMGGVLDAAVDVAAGRVVTFEGDAESTWGEVATYALDGSTTPPTLGPRSSRALIDGDARVATAPNGIVAFSYGAVTEWTLLRDDGQVTLSAPGGRPWSVVTRANGVTQALDALAYDEADATLSVRRATVDTEALTLGLTIPVALDPDSTPRLARLAAQEREIIVNVEQGQLSFRCLTGDVVGEAMSLGGHDVDRVEAAVGLDDGHSLAVLTSGPARVLVVELSADCTLLAMAQTELAAPVRVEDRFFSRDLVETYPNRLVVATQAGAVALDVLRSPELGLTIDPAFDGAGLRGSLARLSP